MGSKKRKMMLSERLQVIEEKSVIDEKLEKLDAFLHGKVYGTLPEAERMRLTRQFSHMKGYSSVLAERIAEWK